MNICIFLFLIMIGPVNLFGSGNDVIPLPKDQAGCIRTDVGGQWTGVFRKYCKCPSGKVNVNGKCVLLTAQIECEQSGGKYSGIIKSCNTCPKFTILGASKRKCECQNPNQEYSLKHKVCVYKPERRESVCTDNKGTLVQGKTRKEGNVVLSFECNWQP